MNVENYHKTVCSEKKDGLDFESEIPFTTIVEMKQESTLEFSKSKDSEIVAKQPEINVTEEMFNSINDITNVCHICFCYSNEFIALESEDRTLANMYSYITSFEILPNENVIFKICETCHNDVQYCYKFKIKCEKSFFTLQEHLKLVKKDLKATSNTSRIIKKEEETQTEQIKLLETDYLNNVSASHTEFKEDIDINEAHVEYLDSEYFDTTTYEKDDVEPKNDEFEINGEDLKVHLKGTKKPKNYYYCGVCQKKFLKEKNLKAHNKSHQTNTGNSFSCGKCKETFGSEHDLNIHSALHTKGNKWTCNKCLKEFEDRSRLRRHVRRHFECKRYACERCDKQFAELCALRRHARVHTGERRDRPHQCALCDKRYIHKSQLQTHMLSHSGARPCTCDTCGKSFPSRRLLASHRLVHSDLKRYACSYCDKRFRHESTRNTHHRTHTGEKPYVCSICGKTFIQNSNLTLHMRTHTGEKPYSCEICGRMFKSSSSLNNHMHTHTGEKPRECPVCGKRFASSSLSNHMRRHTGEKLHTCCACNKTFVTASRLKEHARTHTGEKPFKCSLCSAQYTKESCLLKHMKRHERDKSKNGNVLYVHKVPVIVTDKLVITKENTNESDKNNLKLEMAEEGPIEVSGELILQDDSNVKTELLVIDDGQNNISYQGSEVLSSDNGYTNDDISSMNIVTVDEGALTTSDILEGTTVKLYRLDQNLVQIHATGDKVTISKISNNIANF
ncbi:oocyte zinc finger protein XlCOF6-like [Zerene cesonia]|uniref:oocyte zinc finger protein XlCOF6-like n=1 Tax=Zerene cesonia TaxID=33412 RepID=UPI0018E56D32|nr:oocyte zinc finger protein XlCOF6-like [Zerene cesonia]